MKHIYFTLHMATISAMVWVVGCGGGTSPKRPDGGASESCTPSPEICDGTDNDCDKLIDEDFDKDSDGFLACKGDCDDNNKLINPTSVEVLNSTDDNCDSKIDNHIPGADYDKDGTNYPIDCNDDEPLVGPRAIEVKGDGVDNNCDGFMDEDPPPDCDGTLEANDNGAVASAKAVGICSGITSVAFSSEAQSKEIVGNVGGPVGHRIRTAYGSNFTPLLGKKLLVLSTGLPNDRSDNAKFSPQPGSGFRDTFLGAEMPASSKTHPLWTPSPENCRPDNYEDLLKGLGFTVPAYDVTDLRITMTVPQNAKAFSFKFNFYTAEYPEFRCTTFNDRFIALLESKSFKGNISFDKNNQVISVNNAFLDICQTQPQNGKIPPNTCTRDISELTGSGFEESKPEEPTTPNGSAGPSRAVGGATGWLQTKAPVTPNETITLRFIVLDEGDDIYDSLVLLDDFKWEVEAVTAPTTDPILQ